MTGMTAEGFAATSASYWNSILPRLDHFIRISNSNPVRFDSGLQLRPVSRRQSFVSESGFYLWAIHSQDNNREEDFREAQARARRRLRTLAPHLQLIDDLDAAEKSVAMMLAQRLDSYCSDHRSLSAITIEPALSGCGWISGGLPDLLATEKASLDVRDKQLLAEVKCVDRTFRSSDLRQLVCYSVLYYAQEGAIPDLFAVVNPMRGTALEVGVDEFFEDVVGASAPDVINELLVEWSSAGVSP